MPTLTPVDYDPFAPQLTPVDHNPFAIHKAEEPSFFEELVGRARAGYEGLIQRTALSGFDPVRSLGDESTQRAREATAQGLGFEDAQAMDASGKAQAIAQSGRRQEQLRKEHPDTMRGLQEISEADSIWEGLGEVVTNPRATVMGIAESLGTMAPMLAGGAVTGGAALPAAVGAGSFFTEYAGAGLDVMRKHGLDPNDQADVRRFLEDPELQAEARDRGVQRGVPVAAAAMLSAGLAGRFVAGATGPLSAVARTGAELAQQGVLGGAGEFAAQLATGDPVSPGDIAFEAAAEVPTAIVEVPANFQKARGHAISRRIREHAESLRRQGEDAAREATSVGVQDQYTALAERFGARITSRKRDEVHNRLVGGVPNSQHLYGTAADFVVPERNKAAFMDTLREMGFEAIDEGDHIHAELPDETSDMLDEIGRNMPDIERRRVQREADVEAGIKTPGEANAEDALDRARHDRGLPLDREGPQPPKITRPEVEAPESNDEVRRLFEDRDRAVQRANDRSLPGPDRRQARSEAQKAQAEIDRRRLTRPEEDQAQRDAERALDDTIASGEPIAPLPPETAPVSDPIAPTAPVSPPVAQPPVEPPAAPVEPAAPPAAQPADPQPPVAPAPPPEPVAPPAPEPTPEPEPAPLPEPEPAPMPPISKGGEPIEIAEKVESPDSRELERIFHAAGMPPSSRNKTYEVKLRKDQQHEVDQIAKVLGRKVVLFGSTVPQMRGTGGMVFTGAESVGADSNTIYVHVEALQKHGMPVIGTIGHEFLHTLSNAGNPLVKDLIAFARADVNLNSRYATSRLQTYRRLYAGHPGIEDLTHEELLADLSGDIIADPEFWKELADTDPSLFRRTAKAIMRFINGLIDKAKRLGADDAFDHFTKVRDELREIIKQHMRDVEAGVPGANRRPTEKKAGGVKSAGTDRKPAPKTKPKVSHRKGKTSYVVGRETLQAYFEPGRIIKSYGGGNDRVIAFDWHENGTWSVAVESVERGDTRTHSTDPSQKELRDVLGAPEQYLTNRQKARIKPMTPQERVNLLEDIDHPNEGASILMTMNEVESATRKDKDKRRSLSDTMSDTFTEVLYKLGDPHKQLERWFFDEFRDLKEIQRAIAQQSFGGRLPPNMDAYRYENLRHGAFKDAADRAHEKFVVPIGRILSKADVDLDDFGRFLWWRHAAERDAYLRKNLKDPSSAGPADLAGIDPAEAKRKLDALDPKQRAAMERAAKFVDGMRKHTLRTMLDSGQITQSHHDNLLKQYQHYVPLRDFADERLMDDIMNRPGGRGLRTSTAPLGLRARGRKTEPANIVEHMVRDMEHALIDAQKQVVLGAVVRLIAKHPDHRLWRLEPVDAERRWVDGQLVTVAKHGDPKKQMTFYHRGIPVRIEIEDKHLRKAMLNLRDELPGWLRFVGRLTRWLAAVKTSFSPFFLLVNPVRDGAFATMSILAEHDMATARTAARLYPHAWGALKRDSKLKVAPREKAIQEKMRVYAREFAANGGKTGYTYITDINQQQRNLKNLLARHAKSPGMKDLVTHNPFSTNKDDMYLSKDASLLARKVWGNIAHTVEVANDMAENSTRLTVYAAMREKGMSVSEAAAYAKEITVNFNRKGSFGKWANSFFMFFNAAMQGSARVAKLTAGNRRFQAMMGSLFAGSYALTLAQCIAAGDDDDGESRYGKAVNDMQDRRYLSIYLGDGKSFTLPVPYGPNIFSYAGARLAKATYERMMGRDEGNVAGDLASQVMMSMSPIDPGKGLTAFLPEAARIPAKAWHNENDFGNPLNAAQKFSDGNLPAHTQTDVRTADLYRWIASGMNWLSGGFGDNQYDPGMVNMSGEQVKYIAENFTGGLGRLASESGELFQSLLFGLDPEPSDWPLANVYYRGKGHDRHMASYYDNLDDYENTVADWKQAVAVGDEDKIDEILQKAPWVSGAELSASTTEGRQAQAGSLMEAKRDIDRQMRALRREKDAVLADENLSRRERKQAAYRIDQQMAELQQDFNYAYNAVQPRK